MLGGCVAPVEKMASTASGKPEAVINADLAAIKSAIIGNLVNYGYTIEQDTEYMLRFSRPLKGGEDFAASLLVGNSYSTNRRVTTYTFSRQPEGVRIIVSSALSAQMPGGQVNTSELADQGATFNTFQKDLNEMKAKLEKHP